jgi:hypothetical protein
MPHVCHGDDATEEPRPKGMRYLPLLCSPICWKSHSLRAELRDWALCRSLTPILGCFYLIDIKAESTFLILLLHLPLQAASLLTEDEGSPPSGVTLLLFYFVQKLQLCVALLLGLRGVQTRPRPQPSRQAEGWAKSTRPRPLSLHRHQHSVQSVLGQYLQGDA